MKNTVLVGVVGWRELPVDFLKDKSRDQFYLIFSLAMSEQNPEICQGNVSVMLNWEASIQLFLERKRWMIFSTGIAEMGQNVLAS